MINKIDKIRELTELFQSDGISKEEFEKLKNEILSDGNKSEMETSSILSENDKDVKIDWKSSSQNGFNFPLPSAGGIISGLILLYFISISPCMVYLGGITCSFIGIGIAIFLFVNKNSSKADKIAAGITIIEIVAAWIYFGITWQEAFK